LKPLTLSQSNAEAGKAFHAFTVRPTKDALNTRQNSLVTPPLMSLLLLLRLRRRWLSEHISFYAVSAAIYDFARLTLCAQCPNGGGPLSLCCMKLKPYDKPKNEKRTMSATQSNIRRKSP